MKKGFTLFEVIIAITLITIGVLASFSLITQTVGQMTISSSQLIAPYLSQEGIEIVRNIRDTNWLERANNPANPWDEGLNTPECNGGCEADYTFTTTIDPTLPSFAASTCGGTAGRCLKIDGSGFYNYAAGTETKFKRKITITGGDLDGNLATNEILTVTVETTWTEKGRTYTHKAQEVLYDWK